MEKKRLEFWNQFKIILFNQKQQKDIMIWLYKKEQRKFWICSQQLVGQTFSMLCFIYNQKKIQQYLGVTIRLQNFCATIQMAKITINNNRLFQTIRKIAVMFMHSLYMKIKLKQFYWNLITSFSLGNCQKLLTHIQGQYYKKQKLLVMDIVYVLQGMIFLPFNLDQSKKMNIYKITSNSEGQILKNKYIDIIGYSQSFDIKIFDQKMHSYDQEWQKCQFNKMQKLIQWKHNY
ncbi:unnamed protein product [Paramecium pentaurelia]|uniref:Uncharacterized protein n=1 Tax=Paramecium pentaurelia TaxID=43138 RepID=A0A8S1Y324_9CILI|nr:unnamed protein product [Paramecium pentaurelia]